MPPVPRSQPAIEYAERSDPGRDPEKQVNEDACGHRDTRFGHLCVVCDGMGGHAGGREAAELALLAILEVFDAETDTRLPGDVLRSAIEEANRRVYSMHVKEASTGRPGSTVVAVLLHAGGTDVAHVGDSRAFLVHEGQIYRLTRDHSIVQEMVSRGILTPEQAARHPDANRITRALGMTPEVEVELRAQPVVHVAGDTFVLCSDGLSDMLADKDILGIVAVQPPAQAAGLLVDLANARGGHDNVTVVVLRARETALTSASALPPTVAQTGVSATQAPDTVPTPLLQRASNPPVDPAHAPRGTVPEFPAPQVALVPPNPTISRLPGRRARGPANPAVLVAVALAAVALVLLVAVMLGHLADRGGKSGTRSSAPLPS
jgi:protein phosphatase